MDDDPEVIRSQMEETRSSLTDKIERLEQTVTDKVQGVADTVESVKGAVRDTVDAVKGTNAKILDTRKTTPGWRVLEKYAVRSGGGTNHRMDLSTGVLIKDNHLAALDGDIVKAVERARELAPKGIKIEVECDSFDQVTRAADAGADIILLDNMSPALSNRPIVKSNAS